MTPSGLSRRHAQGLGHNHRPDEQHHGPHNADVVAPGHRGNRLGWPGAGGVANGASPLQNVGTGLLGGMRALCQDGQHCQRGSDPFSQKNGKRAWSGPPVGTPREFWRLYRDARSSCPEPLLWVLLRMEEGIMRSSIHLPNPWGFTKCRRPMRALRHIAGASSGSPLHMCGNRAIAMASAQTIGAFPSTRSLKRPPRRLPIASIPKAVASTAAQVAERIITCQRDNGRCIVVSRRGRCGRLHVPCCAVKPRRWLLVQPDSRSVSNNHCRT